AEDSSSCVRRFVILRQGMVNLPAEGYFFSAVALFGSNRSNRSDYTTIQKGLKIERGTRESQTTNFQYFRNNK
ncbi:MAG: hypothetical protein RRY72_08405, partial [Bacteroides sp.]